MYPVDPSAGVEAVARVAAKHGLKQGVDLTKKYVGRVDMIYSSYVRRLPAVPRFRKDDND